MKQILLRAALCFALLAPAACGNTTGDRALSGGGIGAGVGAPGGLLVGAPLEGAPIGGVIGAGPGALTAAGVPSAQIDTTWTGERRQEVATANDVTEHRNRVVDVTVVKQPR